MLKSLVDAPRSPEAQLGDVDTLRFQFRETAVGVFTVGAVHTTTIVPSAASFLVTSGRRHNEPFRARRCIGICVLSLVPLAKDGGMSGFPAPGLDGPQVAVSAIPGTTGGRWSRAALL